MKTIYKVFEKANCIEDLLHKQKNIVFLDRILKEEISLEDFEKTEIYKDIVFLSKYKDSKWVKVANYGSYYGDNHPAIPEATIEIDAPFAHKIKKAVEDKNLQDLKKTIKHCYMYHKLSYEYEIPKLLVPYFVDEDYIKAILKDKSHINNSISLILEMKKKNPAFCKFINVGWFDEPYMSQDTEGLLKLLKDSLKMCDKLITDEKNGNFRLNGDSEFNIPLQSGQNDSWDEWVHVIPNTIEYACGFSLKDKLKKHKKRKV